MFYKSLAKYYKLWYSNCITSAEYCMNRGDELRAQAYLADAERYKTIIKENEEAIEFFSVGDRAFLYDEVLPKEFRGYK